MSRSLAIEHLTALDEALGARNDGYLIVDNNERVKACYYLEDLDGPMEPSQRWVWATRRGEIEGWRTISTEEYFGEVVGQELEIVCFERECV